MRRFTQVVFGICIVLYAAMLIVTFHMANTPHLWHSMWTDAQLGLNDGKGLAIGVAIFLLGFIFLWLSIPSFCNPNGPSPKKWLFIPGVLLLVYGFWLSISEICGNYDYYYPSAGQGLLAFTVLYLSGLTLFVRSRVLSIQPHKTTQATPKLAAIAVITVVLSSSVIGILGAVVTILSYADAQSP